MTPTEQDKELEICENCGEKCGASLPYGIDCNTELRSAIRKLTTSKVQNVSDAKYGFWHHLDASSLDKIMQLITANYTPNSEVQDLVNTSMADAADEASKAAINQLTMGGEWIPASEVAERERVARINEGQLFREAMIEHSTPAIYWGDRLDELREDKL